MNSSKICSPNLSAKPAPSEKFATLSLYPAITLEAASGSLCSNLAYISARSWTSWLASLVPAASAFPSMSLISGARLKKSFIADAKSSSRTSSLSSSSNSSSKGSSMYGASGMA